MSAATILLIVLGALVVLGVLGLIALFVLHGLAGNPGRFAVRELALDEVDDYIDRRASFAITLQETTPLSRREVWERLTEAEYLSSLPFLTGPRWITAEAGAVAVGLRRTMSGTILSVEERLAAVTEHEQLVLVGTGISLPFAIKNFAERFTITDGARLDTATVTWEIAGSPRWVGWLPWRWGVPFIRPVLGFVLRHVLRLKPFRRPSAGENRSGASGIADPI
ncbi:MULTISPECIES: hypothetical protein [Gordonia]|uniref:hypothetical protein n=1 Tax=Gordonia TaxID=2053 RepID=UPI00200A5C7C|nr:MULTISPECIES: hypothetical protein [Gordonia]MCZ4581417.1 hypothetical protein [Gordonia amicalis]MCZ4653575.1 hypothetical protein [Gordonia amicalis]MDJ0455016.1 hypothetical protein [Gordonia amicalis]MDV7078258.1 hypothetical protein [Gordonia amicalis]UPW13521.1 hypothetical protein M0655_20100 [Gordonia amicalis]